MKIIFRNIVLINCILSLFLLCFPVQAQEQTTVEDEKTNPLLFIPQIVDISETYIGGHFGVATPMDNFAKTNPNFESGFAKTGYKLGLDGSFIFFRNMGLGWTFGYAVNPLDEQAYLRAIHHRLPQSIGLEEVTGTVSAGNWRSTWLTIGPYISLPEEQFMFDFGLYGGLAYTDLPEINFDGETKGQMLRSKVRSDGAIAAALLIQASGNWFIKDNIRAFVKGEMMFARPELQRNIETEMETFYLSSIADEKQSVGLLSVMIGVAYEFENKKSRKSQPRQKNKKAQNKKKKLYLKNKEKGK